MQNLCFGTECSVLGTEVEQMISQQKHPFYSIIPQMMFGGVSEHFNNRLHAKRCKTCVSGLNALFRGTNVANNPFYSIIPQMMFGGVSEHFNNRLHAKRCKTCVSGLNALFRGTNVANNPFYSIGPKIMFVSVTEHFANLRHI
jgi:hypothetical protein